MLHNIDRTREYVIYDITKFPFYDKDKDQTIYGQLNKSFEQFKGIYVIAESIYNLGTQANNTLNTEIAR